MLEGPKAQLNVARKERDISKFQYYTAKAKVKSLKAQADHADLERRRMQEVFLAANSHVRRRRESFSNAFLAVQANLPEDGLEYQSDLECSSMIDIPDNDDMDGDEDENEGGDMDEDDEDEDKSDEDKKDEDENSWEDEGNDDNDDNGEGNDGGDDGEEGGAGAGGGLFVQDEDAGGDIRDDDSIACQYRDGSSELDRDVSMASVSFDSILDDKVIPDSEDERCYGEERNVDWDEDSESEGMDVDRLFVQYQAFV